MVNLVEYFGRENFDQMFYAFILFIVLTVAYFDLRDKNYPPGPFGMPIFGYLPMLNAKTPYKTLKDLASHYGKVFCIQLGSVYTVVISDVKLIREAFNMDIFHQKTPLILANEVTKGKGILMADSDRWKQHRYFLQSTMRALGTMKSGNSPLIILEDKIRQSLSEFIQEIQQTAGSPGDIRPALRHSVGSLMFDVVTGMRPNKEDPQWNRMQNIFTNQLQMMSITKSANFVPLLKNFTKYSKAIGSLLTGKEEASKVYRKCVEKYSSGNSQELGCIVEAYISEMKSSGGTRNDSFSAEQVSQVLLDTLSIGWETTLSSIQWLFVYLAMYPEVQECIAKEMEQVLGAKRENLTLDECKKLKYTEAVLMEVWRHRPVLPMGLPHCAAESTKIGNYWIREGTMVIPLIYAVHRDQRYWDKPDEFIPERHLNDDGSIKTSDYYIPFQIGKKMCIGEEMAEWVLLMFLAGIMNRYKLSFPNGVKYSQDDLPDFCTTSTPPPYLLTFEERH